MTVGTVAAAGQARRPLEGRRRGRPGRPPPHLSDMEPTCHQHQRQTAPPVYPDKIDGAVLKIAGVVVLGAIMSILDITVVNVALPTFQIVFAESPATRCRTPPSRGPSPAYTLALATVIPMTGWAADRFGTKRLYMTALLLFTARLGAVRHGDLDRDADRLPRAAGPRRRHAHAARHDDHDPRGRPGPDGSPDGDPRRADAARPDLRPHPRWLPDRQLLAGTGSS